MLDIKVILFGLSPQKLWVRIPLRRGVLDATLSDTVCQWLATGRWFSSGASVSSTNKIDRHDITEILLKVGLNTITANPKGWSEVFSRRRTDTTMHGQ
jgi:hypothetical protein